MNILIIGSKGFIGSHCVSYFKGAHNVWQCDVVTDYVTKHYFVIDATNSDYNEVFQSQDFDVCINCSGAASVPDSLTHPHRDFTLNVVNVFKQLEAIRLHNPNCKYINLSSAAVYGNPQYLPIDELHPLRPISPYGMHKKMAEDLCESFYNTYQLRTCSLRIFSAYGNGLRKQLFWDLHQKATESIVVSLFGTGDETRDFIHVDDVVRAIEAVIQKGVFNGTLINVASGIELKIKDVVHTFYNLYNPNTNFNFQGQTRQGDPINWVANTEFLKGLGFKTETSIIEGLTNYIQWLKESK